MPRIEHNLATHNTIYQGVTGFHLFFLFPYGLQLIILLFHQLSWTSNGSLFWLCEQHSPILGQLFIILVTFVLCITHSLCFLPVNETPIIDCFIGPCVICSLCTICTVSVHTDWIFLSWSIMKFYCFSVFVSFKTILLPSFWCYFVFLLWSFALNIYTIENFLFVFHLLLCVSIVDSLFLFCLSSVKTQHFLIL